MDRAVLIIGAVAVAGLVAYLVQIRRPTPPTAPAAQVPVQIDRRDFARPEAPWLVAVFTSDTCSTCAGVWERARHLESPPVVVQELEVGRDAAIHARYEIDAVPTLLVVDSEGVVKRWFLGPVGSADLWAAVADARDADSPTQRAASADDEGSESR